MVKVFRGVVSHGGAGSCPAGSGGVWLCKVLSWFGEVLLCVVGWIGVLFSKVRSYCGVAWSVEALHGVVKFGPAKYSVAGSGVFWSGDVRRGAVLYSAVWHAKALFWQGGVEQSEVHQAKLSLRCGIVRRRTVVSGFARLCAVGQALVRHYFGTVLLGNVRWSPARQGPVS